MKIIHGTIGEIESLKEQFIQLPVSAKRIALATDVLTYIDLRLLRPKMGRYFHPVSTVMFRIDQDLRDVVKTSNCYVCAIGALFVAAIMYQQGGKYTTVDANSPFMRVKLEDYFSRDQLALIEISFEGSSAFSTANQTSGEVIDAITFGEDKRKYPNEIMSAIMYNIILNQGQFDPTKEITL